MLSKWETSFVTSLGDEGELWDRTRWDFGSASSLMLPCYDTAFKVSVCWVGWLVFYLNNLSGCEDVPQRCAGGTVVRGSAVGPPTPNAPYGVADICRYSQRGAVSDPLVLWSPASYQWV